jgi:branched-chain amino acid transport system substrate-binding protein
LRYNRSVTVRGRSAALGLLALGSGVLTACGGQLTDAQVRGANGARILQASQGSTNTDPSSGIPAVIGSAASAASEPVSTAHNSIGQSAPTISGSNLVTSSSKAPAVHGTTSSKVSPANPGKASKASTTINTTVGTPGQTGPIIIGSVGNYSGAPGVTLSGLPRGLQVWAAMINNNGGLFGRQVQVIVEDDGGDPAVNGSDVQDLVENKHVVAFVAQGDLLTAQGSADYLKAHGIPVIGSDCSRPDELTVSNRFQPCPDTAAYDNNVFKILKRLTTGTKVGYVYCVESPACSTGNGRYETGAEAVGMQVVYKASISITTIDFTSNCQAAQQAGATIFTVGADPSTLQRFAQSCVRQNYRPQYFVAAIGATASSNQVDGLQGLLLGSYVFPFTGVSGNPAIDEYTNAMAKYDKNEPLAPANAQGWASAKLFQLAATKAAAMEQTITPRSLTDALKTVKNETLGGLTVPLDFTTFPASNAPCTFTVKSDPATKQWGAPLGDALTCS